jgi:hypothetical protein
MTPKKSKQPIRDFLYRTLSSTGVLVSSLVISSAALFFYSRAAFGFIRHESSSLKSDFSLRLFFYVGLMIVSFSGALVVDRLMHGGAWVKRMFAPPASTEDGQPDISAFTKHPAHFYVACLLMLILGWFVYDRLNDRFHAYYGAVGKHMTLLRSPAENDRLAAIEHLSSIHRPEVSELLVKRMTTGTEREKRVAAWAVGQADFASEGIVNALLATVDTPDETLRHTVFLTLARMLPHPTVDLVRRIETELRRHLGEGKVPPRRLLFAAAFLRTPEYLPLFMDFLALDDADTSVISTYALVWMAGTTQGQNRRILGALVRNLTKSERIRCMNTVALLFKAHDLGEETLSSLRREFEAKSSDFSCRPEVFSLHPENPKRDTINITRINIQGFQYNAHGPERYRERILRILARVRDDTMIPWLQRMAKNEQLPEYIRDLCRQTAEAKPVKRQQLDW